MGSSTLDNLRRRNSELKPWADETQQLLFSSTSKRRKTLIREDTSQLSEYQPLWTEKECSIHPTIIWPYNRHYFNVLILTANSFDNQVLLYWLSVSVSAVIWFSEKLTGQVQGTSIDSKLCQHVWQLCKASSCINLWEIVFLSWSAT